jgi:hypothetical protein
LLETVADPPPSSSRRHLWKGIAGALLCLLIGCLSGLLLERRLSAVPRSDVDTFWKPFFVGDSPLIIYSNPLFKGTPYTGLKLGHG